MKPHNCKDKSLDDSSGDNETIDDSLHFAIGPAEKKRYYILITFCMISAFQTNTWFMFASVPNKVEDYYGLNKPSSGQVSSTIGLLLNWCPIMFVPFAPITAYLLSYPIVGLKYTIFIASILVFIGTLILCIPTFLNEISIYDDVTGFKSLFFLHTGEIINAIAGPMVMSAPSKLSAIWFPTHQRTLATGLGAASNTFGNCIAFIMGPYLVQNYNDMPKLLYLNAFLSFIPFLCCLLYLPTAPNKLPNMVAKHALLARENVENILVNKVDDDDKYETLNDDDQDSIYKPKLTKHFLSFMGEMKALCLNKSAFILIIVGGFQSGIFAAWSSVIQDMLSPIKGINDTDIGFIGFNISFIAMSGGIVGWIADKWFFQNLKKFIYILLILNIILLGVLFFILPSPFSEDPLILISNNDTKVYKMVMLNVIIGVMSFCEEGLLPLFYELSADLSYPVSEGSSAMFLSLINNIAALIFISIGSLMNTKFETFFALIVAIICVVLMCFVQEQYKRK